MNNIRVRATVEFEINMEKVKESGLSVQDIMDVITFQEDDVRDGFALYPNVPGYSPVSDFFLCNGSLLSTEIIHTNNELETGVTLKAFAKKRPDMTIYAMTQCGYVVITPEMHKHLDDTKTFRSSLGDSELIEIDADDILNSLVCEANWHPKKPDSICVITG